MATASMPDSIPVAILARLAIDITPLTAVAWPS
jgi:hypothetical protein